MPDRTENSDGSTTQPAKQERPHVDRKARLLLEPNFPVKQPAEVRNNNWDEVFHLFDAETAKAEATRCIQCPAAPCITACPVGNDIPGAFWLLEQGDFNGAAKNVCRGGQTIFEAERLQVGDILDVPVGLLDHKQMNDEQRQYSNRMVSVPAMAATWMRENMETINSLKLMLDTDIYDTTEIAES